MFSPYSCDAGFTSCCWVSRQYRINDVYKCWHPTCHICERLSVRNYLSFGAQTIWTSFMMLLVLYGTCFGAWQPVITLNLPLSIVVSPSCVYLLSSAASKIHWEQAESHQGQEWVPSCSGGHQQLRLQILYPWSVWPHRCKSTLISSL